MGIRNAQTTLNQLYQIRDAAYLALVDPGNEIAAYTLDGRRVEIRSWGDLERLEAVIARYESIVMAGTTVVGNFCNVDLGWSRRCR
jgi:hypothetical protein